MKKNQRLIIILLFSTFYFLSSNSAWGAMLYLEPSSREYHQGDIFLVKIKIDPEGECINAIDANLNFPQGILKAIDFSNGNSILKLWPKEPKIDEKLGSISFVGGIPKGFCGGENNLIVEIVFQAKEVKEKKEARVEFLEGTKVLYGTGKEAKLTKRGAIFLILAEKLEVPKDEWKEKLEKDKIPPQPFEIKIAKEPTIFEGKYFIAFSTIDRETGIDHYEVKEGERDWKRGESPYLLEDQSLKSKILVKAVDEAENERIEEISFSSKNNWKNFLPLIIFGLVMGGIISWIIKKFKTKKST